MKHLQLIIFGSALCAAFAAPLALAAEPGSMMDIFQVNAVGAGPGSLGIIPRKTMFSLYGSIDMGIDYTSAGGKTMLRTQSGNVFISKFGFYGQEDLGDDWLAFFRLESAFFANNGVQQNKNSLFNRGSYVGLTNPRTGTLSLGKQLSAEGVMATAADVFLGNVHQSIYTFLTAYSDLGYGSNVDLNRVNNSISYTTPRFGSFNANVFYALKSNQAVGPKTHHRSATVSYADQRNIASVSYSQTWCDADPVSSTPCLKDVTLEPSVRTDNVLLGYLHDFGTWTGATGFMWNKPRFSGDYSSQLYTFGAEKLIGRNLLRASIAYRNTTQPGNHAWGMTFGEDYFFSKRTSLYARVGFLKNGPNSALTYNFDSPSAFPLPAVAQSVVGTTIGILHNF